MSQLVIQTHKGIRQSGVPVRDGLRCESTDNDIGSKPGLGIALVQGTSNEIKLLDLIINGGFAALSHAKSKDAIYFRNQLCPC